MHCRQKEIYQQKHMGKKEIGYVSNKEQRMQEGDKPGKEGWG